MQRSVKMLSTVHHLSLEICSAYYPFMLDTMSLDKRSHRWNWRWSTNYLFLITIEWIWFVTYVNIIYIKYMIVKNCYICPFMLWLGRISHAHKCSRCFLLSVAQNMWQGQVISLLHRLTKTKSTDHDIFDVLQQAIDGIYAFDDTLGVS